MLERELRNPPAVDHKQRVGVQDDGFQPAARSPSDYGLDVFRPADREVLDITLAKLAAEDPSFRVLTDQESGQTILKGMDELHLDTKVDILKRTYKIDANIGALQVAFRERMTQRVEVDYTHRKILGPKGEFARVKFIVEPNVPGKGFEFESKIDDGAVPTEYISSVEMGLNSVLTSGVVAGCPVVDVKVQLVDGACHDVDHRHGRSIASRAAFREALQKQVRSMSRS